VFLGHSVTQHKNISASTANLIDEEIRVIVDRNYRRAEKILKDNEKMLHMMSDALMKYETIDQKQIAEIKDGKEPKPPEDWTDQTPGTGGASSENKENDKKSGGKIGDPAGEH